MNVFSLCGYYLPLENCMALQLNNFESPLPKNYLCQDWLSLTNKIVECSYLPLKKAWSFIWTTLKFLNLRMRCTILKLARAVVLKKKNIWKVYKQTNGRADGHANDRRSAKLTWAFSSVELKPINGKKQSYFYYLILWITFWSLDRISIKEALQKIWKVLGRSKEQHSIPDNLGKFSTAFTWLEYCRYGVKHKTIKLFQRLAYVRES